VLAALPLPWYRVAPETGRLALPLPGTGYRSPAVPAGLWPWDQTTGAPAHLKAAPGSLLPASYRTPLYLVMICHRWGYPAPGRCYLPCRCPGTGNRSPAALLAPGSPEGRARLPAVRQRLNRPVPGAGLVCLLRPLFLAYPRIRY
jgi:hypothetical protein